MFKAGFGLRLRNINVILTICRRRMIEFRLQRFRSGKLCLHKRRISAASGRRIVAASRSTIRAGRYASTKTLVMIRNNRILNAMTRRQRPLFNGIDRRRFTNFSENGQFRNLQICGLKRMVIFVRINAILTLTFMACAKTNGLAGPVGVGYLSARLNFGVPARAFNPQLNTRNSRFRLGLFAKGAKIFSNVYRVRNM